MQKEQAYNLIKRRSLFNVIPRDLSMELLGLAQIKEYPQHSVVNQNLRPDQLCILISGSIELCRNGKVEDKLVVGRSIELDTLFVSHSSWQYIWETRSAVLILQINFSDFQKIVSKNPMLYKYLMRMSISSETYKFKRDLKLLNVEDSVLQKIVVSMEEYKVEDSTWDNFINTIESTTLIIIKKGSVKVSLEIMLEQNDQKKLVDEYFYSDYFFIHSKDQAIFTPSLDCQLWYIPLEKAGIHFYQEWSLIDYLKDKITKVNKEYEQIQKELEEDIDEEEPEDDQFQVSDFKPGDKYLKKNHRKKYVWLQQHDLMDCGAACMAMISSFYGKKINLATWRSLVHITKEGASMLSLKQAAERVGFDSIGVMSGYKALAELQVPMIALMQYHFVVIYKITEDEVVIADPASQLKTIKKDEFLKEFSNNALLLKPNDKLKKFPNSKNTFLKYLELFKGEKIQIMEVLAISILIFILGLSLPLFTQFVFDNVLVTLDEKFLRFVALIFIALGVLSTASEWIRSVLVAKLTSKLDAKFTSLFLNHTLKLPFSYFSVRNVGDITTRLGEIGKIREFFSSKVVGTFINVFGFILYSAILLLYKKELIYVLFPFIVIFLFVLAGIIKKVRTNLHDTFKAQGKNQSSIFEQMKSFETIKGLGAENSARLRYEETLTTLLQLKRKFENVVNYLQSFSGFYQEIVSLALFVSSIYFYFHGQLSLGQVMAVQALAGSITTPLIQLMQDWDELTKIGVSMEKVDEIMTSKIEKLNFASHYEEKSISGDINFKDIFFQYGNEHSPMVLKKINLSIPQGKVVAFVGGSGSGKTTLAYMINRLYTPTKGKIFLGNINTEEVPLETLRSNVAMISQDNTLFAGSFLTNITIGDVNPDFEKAVFCAKLASAHEFIMAKPGGYYHHLGEGGIGISGGQKQRINIARALYRDPNILIMDEATSALDAKTEKTIVDNLKQRSKNKTTIIIAHRLNTITHADHIFVFDKGHLVEAGGHKELINSQGKYYRMFKKQLELE